MSLHTLRPVRLALASSSRSFATSSAALAKNPPGRGRDAAKRLRRAERAAKAAASGETEVKKEEPALGLEDAVRVLQVSRSCWAMCGTRNRRGEAELQLGGQERQVLLGREEGA